MIVPSLSDHQAEDMCQDAIQRIEGFMKNKLPSVWIPFSSDVEPSRTRVCAMFAMSHLRSTCSVSVSVCLEKLLLDHDLSQLQDSSMALTTSMFRTNFPGTNSPLG